jgi:hypothetical protein
MVEHELISLLLLISLAACGIHILFTVNVISRKMFSMHFPYLYCPFLPALLLSMMLVNHYGVLSSS